MKSKLNLLLLSLFLLGTSVSVIAKEGPYMDKRNSSGKKDNSSSDIAANCTPPTGSEELNINNTRALIQTGGDMWWDLVGQAQYEIPKSEDGNGPTALFAGSLWLGGQDVSGQLKVAAQRFRSNGNDFWTGPLSTTDAEITPETCLEYDEHFLTYRQDVARFVAWYQAGLEGPEVQQENFPDYQIPESILNWPAHGRDYAPYNEDYYLAPFNDVDGDGNYNPQNGDYPRYNLENVENCEQRIVDIYGDQNLWWVFNDKGNIHTESQSDPIGMEIRAQAFAFATNDEVNNMTFYNYELVNRSSFELQNTYFGFWVDPDLGNPQDDYVGCDVERGMGYAYNGDENDEDNQGATGYGTQPPAIGVDFFQGPFQDNDQKDNCLCLNDYQGAIDDDGIPYDGLGVGYGDGIPDNERLGMRAFLYHNNNTSNTGDPQRGTEYYNYLRSFWRDNSRMVYGGTGYQGSVNPPYVEADYMFPGDSDPIGWGTGGNPQPIWTEVTAGNQPFDRRFVQSAGPFRLAPGAVNNITVGVVWSRANSGGAEASVEKLRVDDDKTQALFDACFQLLDGPDAPEVTTTELDREIILKINNPQISNNYNESYAEADPFLIPPDTLTADDGTQYGKPSDNSSEENDENYERLALEYQSYLFQGYQVFQLKDNSVSASDLYNNDLARLVAQCDVKDEITDLVNYEFSQDVNAAIPQPRVENAENDGIRKTFRITTDAFAEGDNRLVNHKTYYFMVIAYGHNNYKTYSQTPDGLDGQTEPYLPSRRSSSGPIPVTTVIPHKVDPRNDGTILNAQYGDGVPVKRIEGLGNSGYFLDLTPESEDAVMSGEPWKVENPIYEAGRSPIEVSVIDPLNVKDGTYRVEFKDSTYNFRESSLIAVTGSTLEDTVFFENPVNVLGERLIPEAGIGITLGDAIDPGQNNINGDLVENNGYIGAEIEFENTDDEWLTGVTDTDVNTYTNWIRSGNTAEEGQEPYWDYAYSFNQGLNGFGIDNDENYEQILDGTWAPFRLATWNTHGPAFKSATFDFTNIFRNTNEISQSAADVRYQMQYLNDVNIYFTSDKSKWTRCVVLETQDDSSLAQGNATKLFPRKAPSVDKDGNPADTSQGPSTNPENPAYISEVGMGWFPGYAIDVQTGERLNMAFGEDSYLTSDNGADMIWNPTSVVSQGVQQDANIRFGGKHFVYVFRNNEVEDEMEFVNPNYTIFQDPEYRMPAYDEGRFMISQLDADGKSTNDLIKDYRSVYRACSWTTIPLLSPGSELLSSNVVVKLRVNESYKLFSSKDEKRSIGDELDNGVEYLVKLGPIKYYEDNGDSIAQRSFKRGDVITGLGSGYSIEKVTSGFYDTGNDTVNNVVRTENAGRPLYEFTVEGMEPTTNVNNIAEEALELIKVVPNPYYAYSSYEVDKLDNRVKIINLPERCDIKIYTLNGILVREFSKDDPNISSLDWDLKNHARIPIASGVYLIHVNVPGVGEKVLKWFGVMRPVDLDSF
ncbi:T9SS C-terminal target domain-containing protein [Salibacter halophilus]|uniref:T9SS C-terminal target domain-containing protein n=1 Tax=Salibacter halophilus TaxID=1803916 RepID=A0A6N6M3T5_9FLAO|nr:T9SS C-terminal target domain-containing protein [Salibacter halophilus]KAB1063815.1 T9SS C-terminal target domain-containing protein [Salibacter halophilus]